MKLYPVRKLPPVNETSFFLKDLCKYALTDRRTDRQITNLKKHKHTNAVSVKTIFTPTAIFKNIAREFFEGQQTFLLLSIEKPVCDLQ